MVDLPMYDLKIKSSIHDYGVEFIDNFSAALDAVIVVGDTIILDQNIGTLYADALKPILDDYAGIFITASEKQKSYQALVPIIDRLIQEGFKKNHRLIAIGGGITQDITGFIASILYRGVTWFFFPTTLLAQGDSCIGSKTSINFGDYKNQLGGFYPPKKIFISPDFLESLPESEIQSGLGEMCHYFIVSGEEDFLYFKKNYPLAQNEKSILAEIIARSLQIKKSYIEIDEFDRQERQIFNYGHSFGHAIESLTDYAVPHGIAVCYGMDMANFVSVKLGYISEDLRLNIRELLEQIWQGTSIDDLSIDRFITALSRDKKNVGNELRLILNKGIGNIIKVGMAMDETFVEWMKEYFETQIKR
jgi:3-dehydroquinate synthase